MSFPVRNRNDYTNLKSASAPQAIAIAKNTALVVVTIPYNEDTVVPSYVFIADRIYDVIGIKGVVHILGTDENTSSQISIKKHTGTQLPSDNGFGFTTWNIFVASSTNYGPGVVQDAQVSVGGANARLAIGDRLSMFMPQGSLQGASGMIQLILRPV